MIKLPHADADSLVSWRFVLTTIILSTVAGGSLGYGLGWLIYTHVPNTHHVASPWGAGVFAASFMGFFMTLLTVSMRFAPGRARIREGERREVRMKIANYLTKYPDSLEPMSEFEIKDIKA